VQGWLVTSITHYGSAVDNEMTPFYGKWRGKKSKDERQESRARKEKDASFLAVTHLC